VIRTGEISVHRSGSKGGACSQQIYTCLGSRLVRSSLTLLNTTWCSPEPNIDGSGILGTTVTSESRGMPSPPRQLTQWRPRASGCAGKCWSLPASSPPYPSRPGLFEDSFPPPPQNESGRRHHSYRGPGWQLADSERAPFGLSPNPHAPNFATVSKTWKQPLGR